MKLMILPEPLDSVEKEYKDCKTYFLFKSNLLDLEIRWFLDCGTSFFNILFWKWYLRLSSAGNFIVKR